MSDIYTHERAGFAERIAALAGGTTYREPVGGRTNKAGQIPDPHSIAMAMAFARQGPNDIGPDIAVAIITQTTAHRNKIVIELAAALFVGMGRRNTADEDAFIEVAADCYLRAVTGKGRPKPERMSTKSYEIIAALGDRILWQAAEEAIRRAEYAYRKNEINSEKPLAA